MHALQPRVAVMNNGTRKGGTPDAFRVLFESPTVQKLARAIDEDPIQVMFNGSVRPMRRLAATLRGLPTADRFSVALTEYEPRDFSLLDINRAGCTKGSALARWAATLGVSRGEVMAVGDNLNDLEMLEFAGRAVIMGNAIADLQERGWARTGSNDEAGVAQAVETFILGAAS